MTGPLCYLGAPAEAIRDRVVVHRITFVCIITGVLLGGCGTSAGEPQPVVTAAQGAPTGVTIVPEYILVEPAEMLQLAAGVVDASGEAVTYPDLRWAAIPEVGMITPEGILTAGTKAGTFANGVSVVAEAGGVALSASARVIIAPSRIHRATLTPSDPQLFLRQTIALRVSAFDEYGNPIEEKQVSWSSKGGTITPGGEFSAGDDTGVIEVTAVVSDGKGTVAVSGRVHVAATMIPDGDEFGR